MKLNLLICDDDPNRRREWSEAVRAHRQDQTVELVVSDDQLMIEVQNLETRRVSARSGQEVSNARSIFDDVDVLFVDYDLLAFDDVLTGEMVSYLARAYSDCGYIVGLNQFGENPFDLTLRGHIESFADLNLGGRQLRNSGLWGEPFVGFRPWSWPILPDAARRLRRLTSEALPLLDDAIVPYFFPQDSGVTLSRSAMEFLSGLSDREPASMTFNQFVCESGKALKPKDRLVHGDEAHARIAAARLSKWLERAILPSQDVLVDAPHLVSRFPSLLNGDPDDVESWNQTATLSTSRLAAAINLDVLRSFEFVGRHWISRPVWVWGEVSRCPEIPEVSDPWSTGETPYVFCEDVSLFAPRDAAREFVADVSSPYARRYVLDRAAPAGSAYIDALKSRANDAWHKTTDLETVEYRPAVRFAL